MPAADCSTHMGAPPRPWCVKAPSLLGPSQFLWPTVTSHPLSSLLCHRLHPPASFPTDFSGMTNTGSPLLPNPQLTPVRLSLPPSHGDGAHSTWAPLAPSNFQISFQPRLHYRLEVALSWAPQTCVPQRSLSRCTEALPSGLWVLDT